MRLDRFLSHAGFGTRKEVKSLLKAGRVCLNGHVIKADNRNIDELSDTIEVDGRTVTYREFYYVLLNKPSGYVSSTLPERNYPPVTDLVSEYDFAHLFPAGRLDVDTTGVLLLTNNGILAHRLISPKYHVDKTYLVTTDYPLQQEMISCFQSGMVLDGEKLLPAKLEILDTNKAKVTLHQGKYHQIKRMFAHYGLTVISLDRLSFAFLNHERMKVGEYRLLNEEEIRRLEDLTR